MAGRDASRVQLDFPELVAELISQLRLTGTVGLLELSDQVTPVYIVAQRAGALSFSADLPLFTSAGITSGSLSNAAANAIVADTGQLPAGNYDIFANMALVGNAASAGPIALQHRNAANAVTLATLLQLNVRTTQFGDTIILPLTGYTLALNERLRVINLAGTMGGEVAATIGIRIRPTP